MKRLINPLPTGGVPFENEDILTLQNEGFDSLKQICAGLSGAFVLSGCGSVIGTETYYGSSQAVGIGYLAGNPSINVVVPAGYVWIDNDIKCFTGGVFTTPFYIKSDSPTLTKKTLQDGTLKNVYNVSDAIGVNSRPTTGQYITCNPTPEFVFQDVVTAKVQSGLNSEISTRQTSVAIERTERTDADVQLNQRLGNLSDAIDTKVTKRTNRTSWIDLSLNAGYTAPAPGAFNGGYNKPQIMRTEDGYIHLRGVVEFTINPTANTTAGTMSSLPSGFQPANSSRFFTTGLSGDFRVSVEISAFGIYVTPFVNQTYVQTFVPPSGTNLAYSLDNITFYADGIGGVQ